MHTPHFQVGDGRQRLRKAPQSLLKAVRLGSDGTELEGGKCRWWRRPVEGEALCNSLGWESGIN